MMKTLKDENAVLQTLKDENAVLQKKLWEAIGINQMLETINENLAEVPAEAEKILKWIVGELEKIGSTAEEKMELLFGVGYENKVESVNDFAAPEASMEAMEEENSNMKDKIFDLTVITCELRAVKKERSKQADEAKESLQLTVNQVKQLAASLIKGEEAEAAPVEEEAASSSEEEAEAPPIPPVIPGIVGGGWRKEDP